ncbi:MAG: hypothetical protein ACT4NX_05925 [Deltaproteobacteria bacterium]
MPIIFMSCECGNVIHVYIHKEKFFELEINPSSWQDEYSEKVKAEKVEELKKFADKLGAEFIDADGDSITCSKCGRVIPVAELKAPARRV